MDDIPVPLPSTPTRFMDRFRAFIRARQLAYRTEKTYCLWVREFIRFHGKRHPESMGAVEVNQWLSHLANNRNVAVNTQKTALNGVVFMYHQFLGRELGELQFSRVGTHERGISSPLDMAASGPGF
ncbi:site-specific integrase [Marinobacter sp.]|uniref:site-specific integrase n=1 Tax=Marinobacter sp. TaxID=50741 RepID=UPI00199FDC94|nr:site-specific integrase [Marinobacter sp.]MBC7192777.1 phage integrase N-terminal SAM-like domain-containing protein [Marinobacter sp.]